MSLDVQIPNENQVGKLLAQVNNTSNATNINLTGGLSVSVLVGESYYVKWTLIYRSTLATTGITVGINGLSGATGSLVAKVDLGFVGADGVSATLQGNLTALGSDVVASVNTAVINTSAIITIQGVFTAAANGQIVPFFRSEVNGSQVSIMANSNFIAYLL